jgi:hypothetical protein
MSLTAEHFQRLQRVKLDEFFQKNKPVYQDLAKMAYDFAVKLVKPAAQKVRIDDVAAPLQLELSLNKQLTDYLASKRLTQKYWVSWFGDYVLDQLWKELSAS